MGGVRWTSEAKVWLRDIHDYIARDNLAAARRTIERIYRKAEVLSSHPEMGYIYPATDPEPMGTLADRTDFAGRPEFDGNRWNDSHYTNTAKNAASERAKEGT